MNANNQEQSNHLHPVKATEWMLRIRAQVIELNLKEDAAFFLNSVGLDLFRYQVVSFGRHQGNANFDLNFSCLPTDWIKEYNATKRADHDPILQLAEKSSGPYKFSEVALLTSLDTLQKEYLERLNAFNFGNGWGIPVFGPLETIGCFEVINGNGTNKFTEQDMILVQAVCQHVHLRLFELRYPKDISIRLSERKIEILFWMSKGKSKRDIAQILNISVHTIDAYIRRIYVQLDVDNNVQAVVKAIKLNIIKN